MSRSHRGGGGGEGGRREEGSHRGGEEGRVCCKKPSRELRAGWREPFNCCRWFVRSRVSLLKSPVASLVLSVY